MDESRTATVYAPSPGRDGAPGLGATELARVMASLPLPLSIADWRRPGRPILFVNEALSRSLARPSHALLGQPASALAAPPADRAARRDLVRCLLQGQVCESVLATPAANGAAPSWLQMRMVVLPDARGEAAYLVTCGHDISAGMTRENQLQQFIALRALADSAARRHFEHRLEMAVHEALTAGREVTVVAVTLPPFDGRDSHASIAHETRIEALTACARDVLPSGTTCCRLHGDGIVATVPPGDADAAALLGALRGAVDARRIADDAGYGSARPGRDGGTATALIETARRRAHLDLDAQGTHLLSDAERLAVDLDVALERGEFHLVFQPQVRLPGGEVAALEALLRWVHPARGAVPTNAFIAQLERSGAIVDVTRWIVEQSLTELARLEAAGHEGLRVAVNLPPGVLVSPGFAEFVNQELSRHGLAGHQLELELTERSLHEAPQEVVRVLAALRRRGVAVAMDDFGTGFSNLSHLASLPLDALKVDMRFVHGAIHNPADAAICRMTVELARALGLRCIVEGIETEGQLQLFNGLHCDMAQGWLFAKGLPAAELEPLLGSPSLLPASVPAPTAAATRHLLLIDDEDNVLRSLRRLFRTTGYRIHATTDPDEGFELLARHPVGVVISDQRMPRMSGTDFLRRVKGLHPATRRIVLSGYTELQSIAEAINEGAIYKFFTKPWNDAQLLQQVDEAFLAYELAADRQRLQTELQSAHDKLARLLESIEARATHSQTALEVLNATLAAVPIAVVGLDPDGFVALSNPAADALLGTGTPLLGGTLELPQRADAGMVRNGRHYRVVRQEVQLPGQRCGTVLSFLEEGR